MYRDSNMQVQHSLLIINTKAQNTENVWVVGSNPILGNSFDFGEDIKQYMLGDRCMQDV